MKIHTKSELAKILEDHRLWLMEEGGERADLRDAYLSNANLSNADLSNADLSDADLSGADLRGADLRGADLRCADLSRADLRGAGLSSAYLSNANLRGADLRDADLRGADLLSCIGNKNNIKSIQIEVYDITYTCDMLQIGFQRHAISEWWGFDDRRIIDMDGSKALKWWRKWKPVLQKIIEMSPAEPTKEQAND